MASGTLVHLAIFASGAVLGAGAVAAVNSRRSSSAPIPTSSTSSTVQQPVGVIETVKTHDSLDIVKYSDASGAVLKYGNPGVLSLSLTN